MAMAKPQRYSGRVRRLLLLVWGLGGLGLGLNAQSAPAWTKTESTWALALEVSEPVLASQARSLAQALVDFWKDVPSHTFTPESKGRWLSWWRDQGLRSSEAALVSAWRTRDQRFLSPASERERLEADTALKRARDNRDLWLVPDLEQGMPAQIKLTWRPAGDNEPFHSWTGRRPDNAAYDWLWVLSLKPLEEYWEIGLKLVGIDGQTWYEGAVLQDPQEGLAPFEDLRQEATGHFLGRPWANLVLLAQPADAVIFINGRPLARGFYESLFRSPGTLRLRWELEGLDAVEQTLVLQPGQSLRLEQSLGGDQAPQSLLSSEPAGARVWLGSRFVGVTPLELPREGHAGQVLELEAPGFRAASRVLRRQLPEPAQFSLIPESIPLEGVAEAKRRFYDRMAWFSLSFASTILLRAFETPTRTLAEAYARHVNANGGLGSPAYEQFRVPLDLSYTLYQSSYWGGWVGVGLTSGLFGWMLWDLFQYLGAVEKSLY